MTERPKVLATDCRSKRFTRQQFIQRTLGLGAAAAALPALLETTQDQFASKTVSAATAPPSTLRVRMAFELNQLDPTQLFDPDSQNVADAIHSHLVRYKPGTTEIQPDLATSWDISSDGKTYTFHLRPNVEWHKGYGRLTAADVKFSIERHQDPASKSLFRTYFDAIDRVDAVDDSTARITLKYSFAPFVSILAFRPGLIVNKKALGDAAGDYVHHPIGTGPYVFDHWTPGKEIVLNANKAYFNGPPRINQLMFIPIADENVAGLALSNDEVDLAYFGDVEVYSRLKRIPRLVSDSARSLNVYPLMMNTRRRPFGDVRVRQAIAYAIDRPGIVSTVWKDLAQVPTGFIDPLYFGYSSKVKKYDYSPQTAKKLLAAAGFPDGFSTSLLYYPGFGWGQMVAVIQQNLAAVGIHLELRQMEFAAYQVPRRAGQYDLIAVTTGRPTDPNLIFTEYFHSASFPPGVNNSYYDKVDDLIVQARSEVDVAKRKVLYEKIQQRMAEDCPAVFLVWSPVMVVRQPRVQGVVPAVNYDLNVQTMHLAG